MHRLDYRIITEYLLLWKAPKDEFPSFLWEQQTIQDTEQRKV